MSERTLEERVLDFAELLAEPGAVLVAHPDTVTNLRRHEALLLLVIPRFKEVAVHANQYMEPDMLNAWHLLR